MNKKTIWRLLENDELTISGDERSSNYGNLWVKVDTDRIQNAGFIYRRRIEIEDNPWRPIESCSPMVDNLDKEFFGKDRLGLAILNGTANTKEYLSEGFTHWRYHIPPVVVDPVKEAFDEFCKELNNDLCVASEQAFRAGVAFGKEQGK